MIVPVLLATIYSYHFLRDTHGSFVHDRSEKKLDRLNTVLQENIAGVRLVKAFVHADHEGERFAAGERGLHQPQYPRGMRFMAVLSPAMSIFVNIGIVLVDLGRKASRRRSGRV